MPHIINLKNLKTKTAVLETQKTHQLRNSATQPTQKPSQPSHPATQLIWSAPEFEYYQKGAAWYLITGVLALGLIIWAFFSKNYFLCLFIVLAYLTLILIGRQKPREIKFAITPRGVSINQTLYYFENLKSFWIFYDPPRLNELSIRSRKLIVPYLKIPLTDQNPVKVREMLLQYLPERKQKESLIENLGRALRY